MATFTSNFSSWSNFEALLTEAQTFESSPAYAAIQSDLVELQSTLFFAEPYSVSGSSTSLTAYYPDGITAHVFGTNLLGSTPVITRADVTNGIYTMVMTGSVTVSDISVTGAITSVSLSGPGYAQLAVGRIPLDGSTVVFTSWSSTLPTDLGSVTIAATGTDTIDPSGNETITYSTISISDGSGHTASISGLSYTVTDGSVDYVALVHELLAGSDVANGGSGDNELYTFAGNDTLDGKAGADTMVGGVGNDTYYVENTGDLVLETDNSPTGGSGLARGLDLGDTIDKVVASINYILPDNVEDLTLAGSALTGTGNELDNQLTGNVAANTLTGNDGADTLIGGAGNDTLIGGLGDDTYLVDNAGDRITENADEGSDSVQSSVTWTLAAHLEDLSLTGAAAINGTGNTLDNILTGNAAANILNGGTGADTMTGGNGPDTYVVDDAGDLVSETNALAAGGSDLVQSSISHALGDNLERLTLTGTAAIDGSGNALANIITGNSGNNTLDGAAGVDTLIGDAGDDTYLVDLTVTGTLQDTLTEAAGAGTDSVQLRGSATLATATTLTLAATLENLDAAATGSTKLNLTGNASANTLTGNAANNILNGGAGADTLSGGLGSDSYVVDNADDQITELDDQGTDLVNSSVSHVLAGNVENLALTGTAHIDGAGNSLANSVTGNSGNNTLDGGAGIDTLAGGSGNDTYRVDLTEFGVLQDTLTEAAGAGTDSVQMRGSAELVTATTLTLAATLENLDAGATGSTKLNLTGNASANILTGNAADNTLDGGAGADTLVGGLGADTMSGGDGADTYVVDDNGDFVSETSALAAGGVDLVQSSISHALRDNLEKLTLTGTAAIDGSGNALANVITGNSGNNRLDGAAGVDTLIGGAGNDGFVVDSLADVVTELADGGYDSVLVDTTLSAGTFVMAANVEYGQLGGTDNLNLTGNAANNGVVGNSGANVLDGGAGNDALYGGGGNDTLKGGAGNDALDGQRGNDQMEGGLGNDSYYVNRGDGAGTAITANDDKVVELAAAGTDTVHSYVYTYTLDANVENLVLESGNTARKGFGNAADNVMTGNSLNNVLSGEVGNDTLYGGDGNDTLYGGNGNDLLDGGLGKDVMTGGAGNDTFIFSTALNAVTNNDKITDFTSGLDTIQLSNSVFTALGAAGGLNASFFYVGTSAQDADDHIIFNALTGALYYDSDGTGGTDQVLFATLAAASALAGTDFVVGL